MDGVGKDRSIRRKSLVLGLRRQSYYRRKAGHRPEEADAEILAILKAIVGTYIAWGFMGARTYGTSLSEFGHSIMEAEDGGFFFTA